MFVYLQSGQYDEAVVTVEKCYAKGYCLPKNDVFFLVSRLTDRKEFALVNRVIAVFEAYDKQFIVDHASLFCYTLLLSGDIMKAFSVISSASDQFIAQWNQDHITSSRSPSSPSLPQEYLFVRLCIQMLNDSKGLHGTLSPFAQAIPRRSTSSPESSVHYEEIIMCYLYSWQYLTAALRAKARNNSVRQLGGDDFGSAASESQSRETLQELFVSPYDAIDATNAINAANATNASRSLETCKFSSFTLQYGDQLLHTTLRSLSLLLWYYYSRSVYQLQRVPASSYVLSPEETIETVFATMRRSFENWSASIFHFFIFFFAQPGAQTSPVTAPSMRSCDTVVELLSRMKGRVAMSDALALMLLKKPDLPTDAMAAIMDFYLDENQPKIQLQSQLVEHQELFASYRSTAEITEFCNGILGGEGVGGNTVERHGRVPEEIQCESLDEAVEFINDKLSYGDMDAYDNIAILTNDEADAYEVYKQLSEYTEVTLITNQSVVYAGGVVVLPKFLAKGMEFDAVYVMTDGTYDGSMVTRHAHYIACTRALHELYVLDVEQP